MKKDTLTETKKNERQENIKQEHRCKFITINPDAENYDILIEIDEIKDYIAQSNEEAQTKEKLEKEAEIKELKDKNKEFKTKIKNLTINQITNKFEKIIRRN